MSWSSLSAFEPALPPHCSPQNDFLLRFSRTFHTCVPGPLAFLSILLGGLSIVSWLFAQLPQIYKNWSLGSTSGLSIYFLVVWCLGDLGNLLGALFTHQATWQITIGAYYVFVDLCLVGQWLYYDQLHHGNLVLRAWRRGNNNSDDGAGSSNGSLNQVVVEGMRTHEREQANVTNENSDGIQGQETRQAGSRPRIIFRTPTFVKEQNEKASVSLTGTPNSNTISRVGASSPMPSPSPRTMLLIACIIALAQASPISRVATIPDDRPLTPLESAGTILSWMSTILYLGSRLPQLIKNWRRKSTAGLSPLLFMAAFCGNLFYSSALVANPSAWSDFEPYGGGGWAGEEGSDRAEWVLAALPFFLGAFGVLGLDASVGVQFWLYGKKPENVVVIDREAGRKRHLRRVSGWLRGWVPSFSEAKPESIERQALLQPNGQHGEDYGAL